MKATSLFPLLSIFLLNVAPALEAATSVNFDEPPYTSGQPVTDSGAPGWTFPYGVKENFTVTATGDAISSPNVLAMSPSTATWITYTSSEALHSGTEGEISFYYRQETSFEENRLIRFDFSANDGGVTVLTFLIGNATDPGRMWYYDGNSEHSTGTLFQTGNWYKFSITYNATSYSLAIDDMGNATRVFDETSLTLKDGHEITKNLYSLGITVDGGAGVAYFDDFRVNDPHVIPETATVWQLLVGATVLGYCFHRRKVALD